MSALPPPVLQIVQEHVHAGSLQDYVKVEEFIARICVREGCPHPYLAFSAVERPTEVWWLNAYSSTDEIKRVEKEYLANAKLMEALQGAALKKSGMTSKPFTTFATFQQNISSNSPWQIGHAPFAIILNAKTPPLRLGAVFRGPGEDQFVFASANDQREANRVAKALGPGAHIFQLQSAWSFPPGRGRR